MNSTPRITRRGFLGLGAGVGAAALLSACGASTNPSGTTIGKVDRSLQVVKRFPPTGMVPGRVRLPISLADSSGLLGTEDLAALPSVLSARMVNADTGEVVSEYLTADRHDADMSIPYWPFVVEAPTSGIYTLRVNEAPATEMSFQIFDREQVAMPLVGDPLPGFDTPTFTDARGVDPICTRPDEPCPFHEMTLTEALASGKPVVYMIGTPAYCKTGTCAPGLDALIEVATTNQTAVFVHADVYTDRTTTKVAEAVSAYSLDFEPVLYIADSTGVLVERLDAVFDVVEIRDALGRVGIS